MSPAVSLDHRFLGCDDNCHAYHKRLDRYCHRSLLRSQHKLENQFSLALDGILPKDVAEEYELVQAHIVARHGDRSPNSLDVIGTTVFYECGLTEGKENISWTGLRDFPHLQSLSYGAEKSHTVHHSLFPGTNSKRCGVGKLTRTGYYQHRALGLMMQKKYAALLLENFTNDQRALDSIYVQSTDFSRTLRSAASFMLGFLPDRRSLRQALTIYVSPGDRLLAPPPGIKRVFKPCKHFLSFHQAMLKKTDFYKDEINLYHPQLEQLSAIFHLNLDHRVPITRLFDSIATRGCHIKENPLPCSHRVCLDYKFANKLFKYVDWVNSRGFTQEASMVGLIPFLRHSVKGLMEEVIEGIKKNPKKFILSLTHDTTIIQLLYGIGVHFDRWMSYASRFIFELWRSKGTPLTEKSSYHIRVLFNGVPITRKLIAWKDFRKKNVNLHPELLPYLEWEKFLMTGPYRDTFSYDEACKNRVLNL